MSIASEASRLSKIINNPIFFEEHTGSEFELMHIKVTLYGLTGILCEKKKERKSRKSEEHLPRKLQPSTQNSLPSSVSSLSSNGSTGIPKTTTESEQDEMFASATHAVVTFKRNVSNSATSISSHLPSMPIGDSSSSFGFVKRYMASWPAEKASPMLKQEDTHLLDQSTFEVQRVMMKESYTPENGTGSADNIANYAYESIELQVHLKRGVEMIPLGMATLVISGEEEGPRRAHLPVKPVSYKGKKMIVSDPSTKSKTRSGKASRLFKKSARKPHFPSYPSEFFTLDETASLKIAVQVIPHEALKETGAARARRVKEEEQRKKTLDFTPIEQVPPAVETETDSDYSLVAGDSRVEGNKARSIFSSPCTPQNQIVEPLTPKTTGFFCANLCLTEPSNNFKMLPDKAKALPPVAVSESSFDATEASGSVNENRYLGKESAKSFESSVLSSVSESESESESEEDEGVHLNRRIVIRNR